MARSVFRDVLERTLEAVDYAHREDRIQELAPPIVGRGRLRIRDQGARPLVATQLAPCGEEGLRYGRKEAFGIARIDEQAFERIAHAWTLHLRIQHDALRARDVRTAIE